jgi:ATP-dependent helicase/nuclease subunit B
MTDNAQTNKEHLPKTLPRGIFNMPAGLPFTDTLARGLLGLYGDNPETFAQLHILLPTRRACRTF